MTPFRPFRDGAILTLAPKLEGAALYDYCMEQLERKRLYGDKHRYEDPNPDPATPGTLQEKGKQRMEVQETKLVHCNKCGQDLPVDDFQPSSLKKNMHRCRECDRKRRKQWKTNNPELWRERKRKYEREYRRRHPYEKARLYRLRHPEAYKATQERYRKRFPEKACAKTLAYQAMQKGIITYMPCQLCGSEHSEKHHADYTKPYEVIWLCSVCHAGVHRGTKQLPPGLDPAAGKVSSSSSESEGRDMGE